jgi:HD-GYP domain-containing protein (c-di-GMP phosphodiesterase class II)
LASAIATLLGFGVWDVEGIKSAAAIHDIGKLVIPAEILSKPGRLTPQEFALVKGHAQAGHDIIAGIDFPWPVAEMVLQHHERQDGSGYPFGLMGADILAGSRVVSVADVVEAMSSHRPYREALGLEAALAEIERGRGNQYPRDVADACLFLCRRPELHFDPRGSQPFGNFP